jgi:hypothetical protein
VERNVQQCRNGKPSLFLKWKLAPGRKSELGVWRVLYLSWQALRGHQGGTQRHSEVIREALRGQQRPAEAVCAVPGREDGVRIVDEGEPPALPKHEVLQMSISRGEQSVEESGLDEGGGVDPPKLPN